MRGCRWRRVSTLTSSPADLKFWSGPPPTATATVQNALFAAKRQVDVAALSAALATQAIARDTDRIANLELDIRERAFFNRRLKGERFIDRRSAEIEDWRAEQARLKGLAERLKAQRVDAEKAQPERGEKADAEPAPPPRPAAVDPDANKAQTPHFAGPSPPLRPKLRLMPERTEPPANPTAGGLY